MRFLCRIGIHVWKEKSRPFVGRRQMGYGKLGPEEVFYPGESPGAPRWRDCVFCGKRQLLFEGKWG
jgi:hypothetical protein